MSKWTEIRYSNWTSSPRSTIGCVQNKHPLEPHHVGVPSLCPKRFLSLWYVWRKPCTYLASNLALSPNRTKQASTWASSRRSTTIMSKMIFEPVVRLAQTVHLLAPTPTLSPNRPKQDFTWATSPRSSIGRIQNDFWAYGTFGANCAPILCQD